MKNRVISALFAIAAFFIQGTILAQKAFAQADGSSLEFSGDVSSMINAAAPWTKYCGDMFNAKTALEGKIDGRLNDSSLFVDAAVWFDAAKAFDESGAIEYASGNGMFGVKLKEAWLDWNGGSFAFRIGRQITAWGKANGLQVTDVLCPQDKTTLVTGDYTETRLGINAVRLTYLGQMFEANAYWIPVFTPNALPLEKSNPIKKLLVPDSITMGGNTVRVNDFSSGDIKMPRLSLESGEYGAQAAAYLPFADISLYYFYGWDRNPFVRYSLDMKSMSINLSGEYKRMMMAGLDAAIPLGAFMIRTEAAFFPNRYFQSSGKSQFAYDSDSALQRNQLVGLIGLDWISGDWVITAQYYNDTVFGDAENIDRDNFDHKATLTVKKSCFSQTLELKATVILGLVEFDTAYDISVSYKLTDAIELVAEAEMFFEGQKEKFGYGVYKDYSCAILKAIYRF